LDTRDQSKGTAGTPEYIAPEIWDGEPHSTSSDVYAFGITLWSLITQKSPYEDVYIYTNSLVLGRAVSEKNIRPVDFVASPVGGVEQKVVKLAERLVMLITYCT
jgi:serine/threonine protein kinase